MSDIPSVFARFTSLQIVAGVCVGLFLDAAVVAIVKMRTADFPSSTIDAPVYTFVPAVVEPPGVSPKPKHNFADLGREKATNEVRYLANWIADSGDNASTPFVIIDKKDAKLYVFDGAARLRAASPVLLGGARGDDTVPGIGSRPIDQVRPEERTTPAGRFVGERGRNARGEDVVWVDYDAAVSIHRVVTNNPEERRLERLASPTSEDNRISYGCINVPVVFYENYLRPAFARQRAPIYVLPEIKPLQKVFGAYDVAAAQ